DHLALADVGDLDEDVVAAAGVGDDVLVVASASEDLLPVRDPLDGMQLVAISRRVLEVETVGRRVHALLELADQDVAAPLHEKGHLVDARLVVIGADAPLTRPRAALDVEVEAHLALLEDLVRASAEREQLADRLD